jgi:hypothetical protein
MNATLDPTLANRYLIDKLSEQERRAYEALLLSSPDAVFELEATARLKVGLARLRETGELDQLLKHRRRWPITSLLRLVAAFTAVVFGTTLWWLRVDHMETAPLLFTSHTSLMEKAGHPLPISTTAAFYVKRTEMPVERIEKPPFPSEIVLRVMPANLSKSHSYRLSLSYLGHAAFEAVAMIDNLTPAAEDGFIECYADSARLDPGRYEIVVTDQTTPPGTPAGVFMFDLVAK